MVVGQAEDITNSLQEDISPHQHHLGTPHSTWFQKKGSLKTQVGAIPKSDFNTGFVWVPLQVDRGADCSKISLIVGGVKGDSVETRVTPADKAFTSTT